MGENNIHNKLIVMDDVSDLANKSNDFANFLTVSRKFNLTGVYVFHTIYPTRSNCQRFFHRQRFLIFFQGSHKTLL